jgi:hypothetical protein
MYTIKVRLRQSGGNAKDEASNSGNVELHGG